MKPSISGDKANMYVQARQEKKKNNENLTEIRTQSSFSQQETEICCLWVKPTATLTMNEERNTAMCTPIRKIASVCTTYYVFFWNMRKKHDISEREDPIGKVNLILAETQYILRGSQKDNYAEYHVFGLNDIKIMVKVLEAVKHSEADANVFHSALQLAVCYKSIVSK